MNRQKNLLRSGFLIFLIIYNVASFAGSKYVEEVVIPPYNSNDPTHVLITPENGKWSNEVLNDPSKKHFYIRPGDYRNIKINLEASGVSTDKRTISLYNGKNIHPASLPISEQANVKISIDGGNYWIINKLSFIATDDMIFYSGSSHNIINECYFKNFFSAIQLRSNANYNTIQKCYLDTMTENARLNDRVAIFFQYFGGSGNEGNHIISNDIRNTNDGIMLFVLQSDISKGVYFPDTVIYDNNIWNDGETYTNGNWKTDGYDENGEYGTAENAIDIKAGSNDINRPILIIKNRMWGYRALDPTFDAAGSIGDTTPPVISAHYNSRFINIQDNIIFDSLSSYSHRDNGGRGGFAGKNIKYSNNIMVDIGYTTNGGNSVYNLEFDDVHDMKITNNTFKNIALSTNFVAWNSSDIEFSNNVSINTGVHRKGSGVSSFNANNNWFFHAKQTFGGTNNHIYSDTSNVKMKDYVFIYKRYTSRPEEKLLKGIISTNESPFYNIAGSLANYDSQMPNNNSNDLKKGKHWILDDSRNVLLRSE